MCLGQFLGVEEVPTVDHRSRQGAVIDLRTGARTPGGAGLGRIELARWSRKNSKALRRSTSVSPCAISGSSSREWISEPSYSAWEQRCAVSLSSKSRPTRSALRWKRLTKDQSRSGRSASRRVSIKRPRSLRRQSRAQRTRRLKWVGNVGLGRLRGGDNRARPVHREGAKRAMQLLDLGRTSSKGREAKSSFMAWLFRLWPRRSRPDSDLEPRADRAAPEGPKQSEERSPPTCLFREERPKRSIGQRKEVGGERCGKPSRLWRHRCSLRPARGPPEETMA